MKNIPMLRYIEKSSVKLLHVFYLFYGMCLSNYILVKYY